MSVPRRTREERSEGGGERSALGLARSGAGPARGSLPCFRASEGQTQARIGLMRITMRRIKVRAMRYVVVDSTAFHPYKPKRPAPLERLFVGSHEGELRLCVPEVVVREVTRHYSRAVGPVYRELRQAQHHARKVGVLPSDLTALASLPDKTDLITQYEQSLRHDIGRRKGEVLPLPQVEHQWVLDRIFGPLKPSKQDEDSYRDNLIWKSVVELAANKKPADEIVFITNNSRDFGDGSGGLHEHLRDDLVTSDLDPDAITLMGTPKEYVDLYFAQQDRLRAQLEERILQPGPVRDDLEETLADSLEGEPLPHMELQLPAEGDISDVRTESVNKIKEVEITDIYHLYDGEFVVGLTVKVDVDVSYTVAAPTGNDLEYAPRWGIDGIEADAPFLMNTEGRLLLLDFELAWDDSESSWRNVELLYGKRLEDS
jgi:hypothetical protein